MRYRALPFLLFVVSCGGVAPDLASSDPYARMLGMNELGDQGDAESVEKLVHFLSDADYLVRTAAIENLGKVGRPEFFQHLSPFLDEKREAHPMVRSAACTALGRIKNAAAIPLLGTALRSDSDNSVRSEAARAMVSFGRSRETIEVLIDGLGDSSRSVAWACHVSLCELSGLDEKKSPSTKEAWTQWYASQAGKP